MNNKKNIQKNLLKEIAQSQNKGHTIRISLTNERNGRE